MRSMKILAITGAVALAPSMASAFTGNLVSCIPTAGMPTVAEISPGLQCAAVKNKISIKNTTMDNCTANGAAPWNNWALLKYGSKISAGDATQIDSVSIDIKASAFGTCDLGNGNGNNPDETAAGGAGKFAFHDAVGEKVKGGKGSFYGTFELDLASQSASVVGLVTKGFGASSAIKIVTGINLGGLSDCGGGAGSCNGNYLACALGLICPPDIQPSFLLDLITKPFSVFRIDIPDNANCVGTGNPFACCTGAGSGNC